MSDEASKNDVLEYASGTRESRLSRLAVLTMLLSILSCPCLLGWLRHLLESWRLPIPLPPIAAVVSAPVFVIAVALLAWHRIFKSRGRLDGKEYCYFALTFSCLWLVVFSVGWLMVRNMRLGPRD